MKHIQSLAGAIVLASSCLSHAAVVNTIDAGSSVSRAISRLGQYGNAPVSENGFTWTSTYEYSMYGWSVSPYMLSANGQWDGKAFPYVGLNYGFGPKDQNHYMKFTFDAPVFLGFGVFELHTWLWQPVHGDFRQQRHPD